MAGIVRGVLTGIAIGGFAATIFEINSIAVQALGVFNAFAIYTAIAMIQGVANHQPRPDQQQPDQQRLAQREEELEAPVPDQQREEELEAPVPDQQQPDRQQPDQQHLARQRLALARQRIAQIRARQRLAQQRLAQIRAQREAPVPDQQQPDQQRFTRLDQLISQFRAEGEAREAPVLP